MRVEQSLDRMSRREGAKTALVCGAARLTYWQVDERSDCCASLLRSAGLKPQERVVISLEDPIATVVWMFGVLKAGGVFAIVAPNSRPERLRRIVADCGAALLVSRGGRLELCRPALHSSADCPPELAALIYTSGSTGGPKGVMLTHGNLTAAAQSICTYLELTSADVILSVLPLAFTYGLGQVTTAFQAGATVVFERSFAFPQIVLATMERERVTGFPLVPTIATLLLQQDLRKRRFPHLRYITNAAAALPMAKLAQLRAAFPGTSIYSMYGQTECQRASYLPAAEIDTRPGSVGIPIPGTDAFIVDDQGRRAPRGTTGELVVKGPHVMAGYWNQPEDTARVLRRDPSGDVVLHTGDLFRADDDGYLYFVERRDDMIKTRGERVAPRFIEETIARIDGVADVAVFGVPDELLGQAIAAVVTLAPGAAVSAAQVKRHCLEQLDAFMVPRMVEIRDALPTTDTGKISRRALRTMMATEGKACA